MADEKPAPPTEADMEALVAALLQVDPEGISGKHDAKQKADSDAEDD